MSAPAEPQSSSPAGTSASAGFTIPAELRALPTSTEFVPEQAPALAYTQSSQFLNWRFSQDQLATVRKSANQRARQRALESWKGKEKELPFPDVDDELELIKFYLGKVPGLTRALALPDFVGAGAMTYMKRFYLHNSCLEWHPKNIMLTCLFLATKTENVPISLHNFASKVAGKNPSREAVEDNMRSIRENEFLVSQNLQFEFMLFGAGRAVAGLLADLHLLDPPPPIAIWNELAQGSQEALALSRLTDAEFLYSPAQIGLACVRSAEAKVLGQANAKEPAPMFGIGQLGSLTKPFLLSKERLARSAAAKARKERDALRQVDEERLRPYLNSTSGSAVPGTDQAPAQSTAKIPNPALALSHQDGSLLGVLDECAALLLKEAELKKADAAVRMERVKTIDRNIKACKPPAPVAGSGSSEAAGTPSAGGAGEHGKKRGADEREAGEEDESGREAKRARQGGSDGA
ncbi:hypothetical protein OC861_004841 [Tilletia horrida]|nr:hypothetical protein OC845_003418 [Tilletia horrida]KAK0563334.1 hypothetical protein OC861_004841 [Tilletia horrida]